MTTSRPLQRILKHHPHVMRAARDFADHAEIIDAARAALRRELAEFAVDREHREDRADRLLEAAIVGKTSDPGAEGPSNIDYSDPTGNAGAMRHIAKRWNRMAEDAEALDDLEHELADTMAHMLAIARHHTSAETLSEPMCEHCDLRAEPTGRGGYRGAKRVAGEWVRTDPERPVLCSTCRKRTERGVA